MEITHWLYINLNSYDIGLTSYRIEDTNNENSHGEAVSSCQCSFLSEVSNQMASSCRKIAQQYCTAKLHRIISSKLVRMMGLKTLFDFKLLSIFYEIAAIETQFMEV